MPKLSIIMPAYIGNYEKLDWMQEALESVEMQWFDDWEVIIIDDFSPISLDVLQKQFLSPKFRWFRTAVQSGPAMCRNTAVELAQAKAILPLDADDQLANENALNVLFTEWSNNQDKFFYGNLRRLKKEPDGTKYIKDEKTFSLAQYTFKDSLNKNGLMPVTCIFSYDCWQRAGGWSSDLDAGREDVEFWIKFGKVGCCGQKIDEETLIYRQHETSRDFALRRINRRESEMINKIRLLHSDVYEGNYPMGCCGGGNGYIPPQNQNNKVSAPSTLNDYSEEDKIWVEYNGNRGGGFGVNGPFTSYTYRIKGYGHKVQVHRLDKSRFKSAGRGQDFKTEGVSPPDDYEQPGQEQPQEYNPSDPILAMIENLDEIAELATA